MSNSINYDKLLCTLFYLENPDTSQPEIIVRFANFIDKTDAMLFVEQFKERDHFIDLSEKETATIH
jgi:hypothetical protein|tara:strand:- start:1874 stop:2071 length:198 start_codon:yes stop_codon:yes gene_type:complete